MKSENLASVNMVSEGTKIIGKLITESDIRVAGTIDGETDVEGRVIVSTTGVVEGNVQATNADIAGRINGEVHADNQLTLRESARVECDIYAESLVVEEGAVFNGSCYMRDNSEEDNKTSKDKSKEDSLSDIGEEKVNT